MTPDFDLDPAASPAPVPHNLDRHIAVVERLLNATAASENLLDYVRFTMPDHKDHSDNPKTRYDTGRHHVILANMLEDVLAGNCPRLIINMGPRHGKTELATKRFLPYASAKFPNKSFILGTYNQTFAEDIGRAVRDVVQSPEHRLVFPDHVLKDGSEAADRLQTEDGGILAFVGRGGTTTGRGGDGIVIDDPIKDRSEADSPTIRDKLWTWFTQVIATRLMTHESWIIVILTRWHEDDLVGRLTDPNNPYYSASEAAKWRVLDLPALAIDDDDVLGRKPGEALWPSRFPRSFLLEQQRRDPRGFEALYQGRPSTDTGNFFAAEALLTYKPDELPKSLRIYAASDHAVGTKQTHDRTAIVLAGVDEQDNLWILPDSIWSRMASDQAVNEMLNIMRRRAPLFWWAERGQISRAIGPFLRKRMSEEKVYASIIEVAPIGDKQARAQSIHARIACGKVFFPSFATWWPGVRDEILKFPHGAHDDFVDALAHLGMGLGQQVAPSAARARVVQSEGTFRAMFRDIRRETNMTRRQRQLGGW